VDGPAIARRRPKRRVKAKLREDRQEAIGPNDVWAMDFVHDQLATGKKIRVLTVVDTFSRYVPVLDPRFSNRAEDVVGVLEQVCPKIGYPKTIRVDQGSEFISRDLDLWAYAKGVTLDFSRSGKPNRQRLYRSLQWSLPSGVFERPLVPDACRCGRKDGGLAQILRRSPPAWGDRAQGADLVDQSRWRNQPAIVKGPGTLPSGDPMNGFRPKTAETLIAAG
jgi:putative transposase